LNSFAACFASSAAKADGARQKEKRKQLETKTAKIFFNRFRTDITDIWIFLFRN
jgi:hypothetical protein